METKTCSITEDEIRALILYHARETIDETDYSLERMNYLNRRLKAEKKEVEAKAQTEGVKSNPEPAKQELNNTW